MGNNPVNSGELIDNKQFSLKDFKINIFNYDNIEINTEKLYKNKNKNNCKIEINIYYYKIKKEILEEITFLKNI